MEFQVLTHNRDQEEGTIFHEIYMGGLNQIYSTLTICD